MAKYSEKFFVDIDFHSLMQRRITRILLVCSSYDQFTLEEDGHIEAQIVKEYSELSLTNPPRFTRVSSPEEALAMIDSGEHIDLIISMFNIGQTDIFTFSQQVKSRDVDIPFVLLSSFSREVARRVERADTSGIDYMFSWQGNADLILAIIKMIEDRINAREDILGIGVQAILLVEDNVRFYSAYLPDLYHIVIRQSNEFLREALNEQQRNLRKRARPKILLARSYDEAVGLYELYKENLLGVISDVSFSCSDTSSEIDHQAGFRLCRMILDDTPTMPILLQSSNSDLAPRAKALGVDFIHKSSKSLLRSLSRFINYRLAFGDFTFVDPESRQTIATAHDLGQMQDAIEQIPLHVMTIYTERNMLSKWLYARGIFSLAHMLRAVTNDTFDDHEQMRAFILTAIKGYRRQMGQGVVAEFDPATYNQYISFARSGSGSLGGKARGLAFIGNMLEDHKLYDKWDGVRVTIPRTLVLATDHFDRFITENGLDSLISEELEPSDADILTEFLGSRLPESLVEHLRVFLRNVHRPLAVRSSSKLEDSHFQPFAGVYSTYMVPRADNPEQMLRLVGKAVKSVYASVYYRGSRAYIEASANALSDEKMGVVIQEICGTADAGYYFPTISGVARSINFYPIGDERAEDGIANIALGLGKLVVEGGTTLRFSPGSPRHALQLSSPEITLRDTQRIMYALDLDPAKMRSSTDDAVNLATFEIQRATHFRNMKYVASTWDAQNQHISDSASETGRKLITFAHILKYGTFPLAEIIAELLKIGEQEMKSPVEIEFAVNMDVPYGSEKIFNFLQIRPIVAASQNDRIDWQQQDTTTALIYANSALGLGRIDGLRDIIYLKSGCFDPSHSADMALEIDRMNDAMRVDDRNYILVGPGRWGSSDPWLGIPVRWSQISQARVIVECGLENFRVEPSQGTHFFQNLTSFGVGYMTVDPYRDGAGVFDNKSLDAMTCIQESVHFRHVRFDRDLFVFVDGKNSKGIVKLF